MKTIAIIGIGLIGGSLGKALRATGKYHVVGFGRDRKRLSRARACGAADEVSTDVCGIGTADVVVVAVPVDCIASTVERVLPFLKPGVVITDVGSVKGAVIRGVRDVFSRNAKGRRAGPVFVGGHPLAGLEQSGVEWARADLYRGAAVVLTPDRSAPAKAVKTVESLWRAAGADVLLMTPAGHDRVVALTSHVPHILAFELCRAASALSRRDPRASRLAAGSFRDTTRVADSSPRDWAAICLYNREAVERALDDFIARLSKLRGRLSSFREMERIFTEGRASRRNLFGSRSRRA